jgi:hypothetical protein
MAQNTADGCPGPTCSVNNGAIAPTPLAPKAPARSSQAVSQSGFEPIVQPQQGPTQQDLQNQLNGLVSAAAAAQAAAAATAARNAQQGGTSADFNQYATGGRPSVNHPASADPFGDDPGPSSTSTAGYPKDPDADYTGQSCSYFTRPSDSAHHNFYHEGSWVAYGSYMYRCQDGHWAKAGPRTAWPKNGEANDATQIEGR